jgi:cytochrome c556
MEVHMIRNLVLAAAGVALVLAAVGSAASAPNLAGKAALDARKANFKEIGGAFKTINDEIKSGSPDMNSVRPAARELAARAAQSAKYFPRGSGAETGAKTRAKPDIWANPAAFQKAQATFAAAADKLNSVAASGDVAALTSARTALGEACKSCHERFRQPE